MILTLEAYKDNLYVLKVLNDIFNQIKDNINDNPYKEINLKNWSIKNDPVFKDNIESNLIFRNDSTQEDINITFKGIDELTETDEKFKIESIVLYKENGKNDEKIELNNYIYSIVNSILELLENKEK